MGFSSPNKIIWEYFDGLQRLARHANETDSEGTARQYAAMATMLSVTTIDAFVNVYFRVIVSDRQYSEHEELVLKHIRQRKPTEEKLKQWTRRIFGNQIDLNSEAYCAFRRLTEQRNALVHFKSSHETHSITLNLIVEGLADTTVFDELTAQDALTAVHTARAMLSTIFACCGISEDHIPHMMHGWTGYPVS